MKVSSNCPCCGQVLKGDRLWVSLDYNTFVAGNSAVELSPKQAEIVFVLLKRHPCITTYRQLMGEVWGDHSSILSPAMRTMVYQTRIAIEKFGYTIKSAATKRGYVLKKL